jgi:Domain of unknown function (DUF4386)
MGMSTTGRMSGEDQSVLRSGGVAGILGAILSVVSLVILPGAVASPQQTVATFPSIRTQWLIGDAVYLAAFADFAILVLALYRALKGSSLAPALFGGVLGLLGIVLLVGGSFTGIVLGHISDLYHASGVSSQDQVTLTLAWEAIEGVFTETDTVGGIFLALGFILLGMSMFPNPRFGRPLAGVVTVLGLIAVGGIAVISIGQGNPDDYAFVVLVLVLPLLLGWKLLSV